VDDRKDRNHAGGSDGRLLRIPLDTRASPAGAVAGRRFTNRYAQSARDHRFDRDFISSGVLRRHSSRLSAAPIFCRGICPPRAHGSGETLLVSSYISQLRAISSWGVRLLFLVAAEDDSFFLSRHRVTRVGAHLDRATILFFRNSVHDRLRVGFRIASGGAGPGSIWIDHLQIHGAHTTLRCRADFYSGDDHHADTRHSDLDRDGAPDVPALRKLHLDCMANGAPQVRKFRCFMTAFEA